MLMLIHLDHPVGTRDHLITHIIIRETVNKIIEFTTHIHLQGISPVYRDLVYLPHAIDINQRPQYIEEKQK